MILLLSSKGPGIHNDGHPSRIQYAQWIDLTERTVSGVREVHNELFARSASLLANSIVHFGRPIRRKKEDS